MSWLSFFVGVGFTFILLFIISICIIASEADDEMERNLPCMNCLHPEVDCKNCKIINKDKEDE